MRNGTAYEADRAEAVLVAEDTRTVARCGELTSVRSLHTATHKKKERTGKDERLNGILGLSLNARNICFVLLHSLSQESPSPVG